MTSQDEAPREIIASTESQPDALGLRDPQFTHVVCVLIACDEEPPTAQERRSVVAFADSHRLREARRAGRQQSHAGDTSPAGPHQLDAFKWLTGAKEDRFAYALPGANDVRAPVHPIGEIHVQMSRRPIHRAGSGSHASIAVRSRIEGSPICLYLDEPHRGRALIGSMDEDTPDELPSDAQSVA